LPGRAGRGPSGAPPDRSGFSPRGLGDPAALQAVPSVVATGREDARRGVEPPEAEDDERVRHAELAFVRSECRLDGVQWLPCVSSRCLEMSRKVE